MILNEIWERLPGPAPAAAPKRYTLHWLSIDGTWMPFPDCGKDDEERAVAQALRLIDTGQFSGVQVRDGARWIVRAYPGRSRVERRP